MSMPRAAISVLDQQFGEAVGAVLGARKHQHLVPILRFNQMAQQLAFLVAINRMHFLRDRLDG